MADDNQKSAGGSLSDVATAQFMILTQISLNQISVLID